jgi:hypothetical protein
MKKYLVCLAFFILLFSCVRIKEGESWKMEARDKTIGLTLLWNLPEEKLKEMLPPNQRPRIQNGKGVLMLFLCSTDRYSIGKKNYGSLGVAHLIIPLKDAISLPETIGLQNQAIITGLKKKGFPVRFGDIKLQLEEVGDSIRIQGDIIIGKGEMHFSGKASNIKGNQVSLENTTLVGIDSQKDILSGPEFYKPIAFKSIAVKQSGENWIEKYHLTTSPDRIWVNVDFGVDFKYLASRATHFATPAVK